MMAVRRYEQKMSDLISWESEVLYVNYSVQEGKEPVQVGQL